MTDQRIPVPAAIMDNLPGMAYRCLNDENRTMEYVSEGGTGLTGYIPSALIKNRLIAFADIIHPDDRPDVWEQMQASLSIKNPFVLEYRIQTAHGPIKWVWDKGVGIYDENGKVIAIEGFIINITNRKQVEEELKRHQIHLEEIVAERTKELRDSEEMYKTLYNSSMDALMMLDKEKGFYNGNPAAIQLFGCSGQNEFKSMTPSDLSPRFQPDGKPSIDKSLENIEIAMQKGSHFFEWTHRRLNGEEFIASVLLTRMKVYGEDVLQANVRDITESKKAEAALRKEVTQRELAESQLRSLVKDLERANADLESFAYIVSHDLKAPLRSIGSLASWILEDYGGSLDSKGHEYLEKLQQKTLRMHKLIDGILKYSCAGKDHIEHTTLNAHTLVLEIIEEFSIPEGITVGITGQLPVVLYNKVLLEQIFRNLIGNALKHMGKPQGEITIACVEGEEKWEFCVRDTGVGIEEKHFERIFKIFQSLKTGPEDDSTGIGLALVKKLVEQNGGSIWVESEVGQGSAFYFTILKGEVPLPEQ